VSGSPEASRRGKRVSSVSSSTSLLSHNTSGARASALIKSSLSAAADHSAASKKQDSSLHVIRQSTGNSTDTSASPQHPTRRVSSNKNAELIRRVSDAVKESEREAPLSPPRRSVSLRSKSRIQALARPIREHEPDTTAWTCVDLIQGVPGNRPYAMIILNQPIARKDIFLRAWAASEWPLPFCLVMAADSR
jgi:hypothetical protein